MCVLAARKAWPKSQAFPIGYYSADGKTSAALARSARISVSRFSTAQNLSSAFPTHHRIPSFSGTDYGWLRA
jgi:hypothetical protein